MVNTTHFRHLVLGVSVLKKLNLYEFPPLGRNLVSIVHFRERLIIEVILKAVYENFVST